MNIISYRHYHYPTGLYCIRYVSDTLVFLKAKAGVRKAINESVVAHCRMPKGSAQKKKDHMELYGLWRLRPDWREISSNAVRNWKSLRSDLYSDESKLVEHIVKLISVTNYEN